MLPNHVWEKILVDSNLTGRELARLVTTSSMFRNIIKNNPNLLAKLEYNKRWASVPLKELENIASNLRKPPRGPWTNRLLKKYEEEINRRKK
jgi:hypothetical protein